jgi:hypothetical protein
MRNAKTRLLDHKRPFSTRLLSCFVMRILARNGPACPFLAPKLKLWDGPPCLLLVPFREHAAMTKLPWRFQRFIAEKHRDLSLFLGGGL